MSAAADRPTIYTVAARAGVSKSLVSLVLRGSPKVSPDRRAAVQRAIAELGYRPNTAARELREGRSRTVGALLNDMRHPWLVDVLDGLTERFAEQGRQLLLHSGRLDRARDDAVPRTLADLGVDGLVLVGTQADSAALAEVSQMIPTVAVAWRDLDLDRVDTVANDDLLGSTLATRHLIELGHRRIAHIAGHVPGSTNAVGALRRRGYEETMREHGLAAHIRVETTDHSDDGGYRAAVRLLRSAEPADRDLRRRRRDVPGRAGRRGRAGCVRTRRTLPRRLRQLPARPAALDLAHQRRQRRGRAGQARRPHARSPDRRPRAARAAAPARADAAGAQVERSRAGLTRLPATPPPGR